MEKQPSSGKKTKENRELKKKASAQSLTQGDQAFAQSQFFGIGDLISGSAIQAAYKMQSATAVPSAD